MLLRVFGAMVLLGRSDMCGEVAIILNAMSRALIIFLVIMFAALTAACSSILPDATAQIAAAPVGPPADYRKLIRRRCTAQPADPASYGEKAAPQAQVRRSALGTVKVVLKTPRGKRSHAV